MSNDICDFIQEKKNQSVKFDLEAAKKLVDRAEYLGKSMADNRVTTTQIRNVYGTMKKLEMLGWNNRTARELWLMKPRLAYAAKRQKNVEELKTTISEAIDCVNDAESFKRFCQFFEAIVAYHRAHGGS
ncbi:type III-A CRISPR-associated protein Csm2 [Thioflexithrix psekupsensis]|uniref:CRISPR system Cms protein Csm2 n=1 Tax=Thioflexithrix psekupsensis TaxID=1570016 RepID=A0A251X833_9GAMM|nr:type III-A CRISPR-associated protein Csm2 [Thioflexithrix psekupsensis]OUD14218.1 type III-A CRISPR-associated protein Csm2 [Thioflexithrix psekupsensis]